MAKFGNFNYSEESSLTEVLTQYKEYRKKDLKGMVKQTEIDALKASLEEKDTKLKEYVTAERTKLVASAANKVNSTKAEQLIKYTTLAEDFDYSDESALEAALTETNTELFTTQSDEASRAKTVETGIVTPKGPNKKSGTVDKHPDL